MKDRESPYIIWFRDYDRINLPKVGGKNANLGEMMRFGVRVPPGFAVTIDAYNEALDESNARKELYRILDEVQPEDTASINKASEAARQLIRSIIVPEKIGGAIEDSYQVLAKECGVANVPVAIRSSATAEDLPGASFAGQHETYLWVRGKEGVKKYIKECWSSLFTPRAISYRIKKGFLHEKVLISVGVQGMINAKVAGVSFTLNPLNGDLSKVVISASWGLGEPLVSGEVTPDEWLVDKVALEIIRKTISPKTTQHIIDPVVDKKVVMDIPPEKQNVPCLSDEEVIELTKIVIKIEEHFVVPQDIEWALHKDLPFPNNIFMVQTRPETVWSQREAKPIVEPGTTPLRYIISTLKTGRKLK